MRRAISREANFLVPCHSWSRSQPAVMRLVPPCCPPLTSCPNMSWVLVHVTSGVFSALSSHHSGACCVPSAHGQVLPLPFTSSMFLVIYCVISWGKLFKPWKLLCLWQDLRMGHEQALKVSILHPNVLKGNKIRTSLLCYALSTLEVFAFVYKGQWCREFFIGVVCTEKHLQKPLVGLIVI